MTTHEDGACCALPSKEQTRQRLAKDLMYQAVDMIKLDQVASAETLIKAAYVLLDESGGRTNATGAWLLQMQANICEKNGQLLKTIEFSRMAKEMAKEIFGRNDAFTCTFMLFYALNLAQAGYERGLSMVEKGIKRLEKAAANPNAPAAWVEYVLSDARKSLARERKTHDPKKACKLFAQLYSNGRNGVYSVELSRKGNNRKSAKIVVKLSCANSLNIIAEEHRQKYKGIPVEISVEPAPGMVTLHRAS